MPIKYLLARESLWPTCKKRIQCQNSVSDMPTCKLEKTLGSRKLILMRKNTRKIRDFVLWSCHSKSLLQARRKVCARFWFAIEMFLKYLVTFSISWLQQIVLNAQLLGIQEFKNILKSQPICKLVSSHSCDFYFTRFAKHTLWTEKNAQQRMYGYVEARFQDEGNCLSSWSGCN